jgi:hypothetical protein
MFCFLLLTSSVQLRFDDQTKLNLLDVPTRVLLREGDLEKQARRGRQTRHFWLFNDKLVYGQARGLGGGEAPAAGAGPGLFEARYTMHLDIDLRKCHVGAAEVRERGSEGAAPGSRS